MAEPMTLRALTYTEVMSGAVSSSIRLSTPASNSCSSGLKTCSVMLISWSNHLRAVSKAPVRNRWLETMGHA